MIYLNVDKFGNIDSCKILNEEDLRFENGLAVANVHIKGKNFWHDDYEYDTYTIIREVKDEKNNELIDYELVNQEDSRFRLPEFVKGIARTGNHYLFSILTGDDSSDIGPVSWMNYWHYEYDEKTETFTQIGKLKGEPTITKNPDLIILNDSQLYSLSKKEFVGNKYSSIEDIDGNSFFVVDHITTKTKSSLHNNLMFVIDKEGNKTSKVFSRNKKTFTDDDLSVPYVEIRDKEIQILEDTLAEEEKYKMLMKLAKGYEQ